MIVLSSINFLSIILFIISLSVLVVIHELGHYSMAKLFNVYCFEFSVGFGHPIFQRKKPDKETTFSIRIIPLGGYVSMYGESDSLPEGLEVPKERSLLSIKKWKRAIIMGAGIFLNFVLGFLLFAGNNAFFPQEVNSNQITVVEDSLAAQAGLKTGDHIYQVEKQFLLNGEVSAEYPLETYTDIKDINTLWNEALTSIAPKSENDVLAVTLYWTNENNENKSYKFTLNAIIASETKEEVFYGWEKMGITVYRAHLGAKDAFVKTCTDWWDSATEIGKSLGSLIVGKGWNDVGGPLAILSVSSDILQVGFGQYLWLWGMISVNLGLINLLPFPGLDGWHLLIVAIEGICHKEVPSKVKNIISTVGIILLFILMGVIFIKDIFGFFIALL